MACAAVMLQADRLLCRDVLSDLLRCRCLKGYRIQICHQRSVRLVVNLSDGAILRQEDLLEASIEMAAAAAELFIGQGIRTSLETNLDRIF